MKKRFNQHEIAALAARFRVEDVRTTKALRETLGAIGFAKTQATEIYAEMRRQQRVHDERAAKRERSFASKPFGQARWYSSAKMAPWQWPIEDRIVERLAWDFRHELKLRYGAAGGSSYRIVRVDDPAKVGYRVLLDSNRSTYSGRYRGYSAVEDHHTVSIPRDWRRRVAQRGLTYIDGMVTLDASPLDAPAGVELFAAKWARQGSGFAVVNERGFIARIGAHTYHAETVEKALAGIKRKAKAAVEATISVGDLGAKHADVWVSLADVKAVGACDYGIRSWVHRAGFEAHYEAGGCTVAQLAAAYAKVPASEIRAAIVYAVRRSRKAAA